MVAAVTLQRRYYENILLQSRHRLVPLKSELQFASNLSTMSTKESVINIEISDSRDAALDIEETAVESDNVKTRSGSFAGIFATFKEALEARADRDKVILISVLDLSYLDLAVNLLTTSYRPHNIENFIFICMHKEAEKHLQSLGVPCFVHIVANEAHKASVFGSKAFIEKTLVKPKFVLEALKLGYHAVLVDLDIVFFKNPKPYLDCKDFDICIQDDSVNKDSINSGFYIVHPSPAGIRIHQDMMDILTKDPRERVQKLMRNLLVAMRNKGEIRMKQLDLKLFPPGRVYFEDGHRMFLGDNPCTECVLVHNNWILHKPAKVYRMKETGLWGVDMDGYYSNPDRKYIAYSNTLAAGNMSASYERNALKVALWLGKLLNRTVILPRFTCHDCDSDACATQHHRCSMNVQFSIAEFDRYFTGKYRESCFLNHSLVPTAVKKSLSPLLYIDSSKVLKESLQRYKIPAGYKNRSLNTKKVSQTFAPKNAKIGVTSDEIVSFFSSKKYNEYSILNFHSLYYGLSVISKSHSDKKFSSFLDRALTGADYRQNRIKEKFAELGP